MEAWERIGSMDALSYHAGVRYDNRALLICGASGGTTVSQIVNTQNGYNFGTKLNNIQNLSARVFHAACVFNERIFVSGGTIFINSMIDVLVTKKNEDYENWYEIGHLPEAVYGHKMVAFGNQRVKLVTLGGYNPAGSPQYKNSIYESVDGCKWVQVLPHGSLWSGRLGFGVLVYKNKLWLFGGVIQSGQTPPVCYDDVWWTDDLIHWHLGVAHAPWGRRAFFGYCIWDERMWIIGGQDYDYRGSVDYKRSTWFSRDGTTWEQAFDFPSNLSNTYADELDNRLYVFGGTGNTTGVYRMNLG